MGVMEKNVASIATNYVSAKDAEKRRVKRKSKRMDRDRDEDYWNKLWWA